MLYRRTISFCFVWKQVCVQTPEIDTWIYIYKLICVIIFLVLILASNEIFSPSNKIHREVGRAKDLSAPRYKDRAEQNVELPDISAQ